MSGDAPLNDARSSITSNTIVSWLSALAASSASGE
jgi:hypothetical protein